MGKRTVRIGGVLAGLTVAATVAAIAVVPAALATAAVTSNTLLTGKVTDGGSPVSGAPVFVMAWPNQTTMNAQDSFTTPIIQSGVTAPDGSYAVSPNLMALGSEYVNDGGGVNLDVYVDGAPIAVSAAQAGSESAGLTAQFASPDAPMTANLDTASSVMTSQMAGADAPQQNAASHVGMQSASAMTTDGTVAPLDSCVSSTVATYTGKSEAFLHLYSDIYAPAYVTETASTKHSLGVGFSFDGAKWSADGSATVEWTGGASLTSGFQHNWTVYNKVNYRKYHTVCYNNAGSSLTYSVRSLGVSDVLTSDAAIGLNTYTNCRSAAAGQIFNKNSGKNLYFSASVGLGFFTASAQAGYSNSTDIQWKIRTSGKTTMCGNNNTWLLADNAASHPLGSCDGPGTADTSAAIKPDC